MRSTTSFTTKKWNEEPLARSDRVAEAIRDFNIQLHRIENTMNHIFELNSIGGATG
jgi:hypothetical protein